MNSGQELFGQQALDELRAVSVGGARILWDRAARLVLASEDALLNRGEADLADTQSLAGRHYLGLDDPVERVVLGLVGD